MQAFASRESRIHEWAGQVEPATRVVQHPFHEGAHVLVREDQARELGDAFSGDKHSGSRVNPDLFDLGIVHESLKWAKATDVVDQVGFNLLAGGRQQVWCVFVDRPVDEGAHGCGVAGGVNASRSQPLSNPRGERARHGIHGCASSLQTTPLCRK